MNFDEEFRRVVLVEGGYSDHPSDSGGKTMYGITEEVARAYGYVGEMKDMPLSVARRIYRERYWDALKLDEVAQLAPKVAGELFDSAVNCGQGSAGTWLQRALNAFNRRGELYPEVGVDGAIGRMSIAALKAYVAAYSRFGADAEAVLMRCLNSQQGAFYLGLSQQRQKDEDFVFGWFRNRVV